MATTTHSRVGGGDDTIDPGADSDGVDGGPGSDAVDYVDNLAGVSVDLAIVGPQATGAGGSDSLPSIENVHGTHFPDMLRGDGGPNRLIGDKGEDLLDGRGGQDLLEGGPHADSLDVRDGGPDSADCGSDTDTVTADLPGIDTLTGCENPLFPAVTPSGGNTASGGPSPDTLAPAFLGRVRAVPARFRAGRHAMPTMARTAGGTTFRYSLSEAATATFVIDRRTSGRKVTGACGARTRANAGRPKCSRFRRVGSFLARAAAGANRTPFSGRLGNATLKPGSYRALVTAVDSAGNGSKTATATFKTLPRRHRGDA